MPICVFPTERRDPGWEQSLFTSYAQNYANRGAGLVKADYGGLLIKEGIFPRLIFDVKFTSDSPGECYFAVLGGDLYIRARNEDV